MNVLLYAENYIFPCATQEAGKEIREENRDRVYALYEVCH